MTDKFSNHTEGLSSPPGHAFAIAPDDTADLPQATRCLNAATAGAVRLTTVHGDTETLFVAAGIPFPVRAMRVWATGTTATGLVGLY